LLFEALMIEMAVSSQDVSIPKMFKSGLLRLVIVTYNNIIYRLCREKKLNYYEKQEKQENLSSFS